MYSYIPKSYNDSYGVSLCLNPYSGGKCIPIPVEHPVPFKHPQVSILIQVVNVFLCVTIDVVGIFNIESQSLFRW